MKPKALLFCLFVAMLLILSGYLMAQDVVNLAISKFNCTNPLPAINPSPGEDYVYWEFVPWGMMFCGSDFTLSWQPDLLGPMPDGYRLKFADEPEIDLGPVTSWQTPWLGEGSYSWQVVPYIIDIAGNKANLTPIINSKGDAQGCPWWTITLFADYEMPPLPGWYELTSFTANYDNLSNAVTINWETLTEENMIGYSIYRNTEDSFWSAVNLTFSYSQNGYGNLYQYTDTDVSPGNTYYYWLEGSEAIFLSSYLENPISITLAPTDIEDQNLSPVLEGISSIYPNPIKKGCVCNIQYKHNKTTTLDIFNIKGQLVQSMLAPANSNTLSWDGRNKQGELCSNGIYFCKLSGLDNTAPKRIVIVQ